MGRVYKVGQLATATGLTVRTLHHYDHVGLVCPSMRTASGYRLYDESDVQRLYEVLALRQLGLSLEDIGAALSGTSLLAELLTQHRDHLDRRLVAMRTLRAQLTTMLASLRDTDSADVTDFLALIRKVVTVDETVKKYFSDTQLAELAERREQVGEQAIADVQQSWQTLIPRVQQAVEAGTDPVSPEGQELAREWMELIESFHGGDDGLRDSLYRMQADNADKIEREHGGPSPQQIEFIKRANAVRS
jgi:DNA-binding transcriptional MerR regulator